MRARSTSAWTGLRLLSARVAATSQQGQQSGEGALAGRSTLPRGLRLSALLVTGAVVVARPFFAGTPSDYAPAVLTTT